MLPGLYETPYSTTEKNGVLEKGIHYYVREIASINNRLIAEGEDGSLLVDSITHFLTQLSYYGYYAYFVSSQSLGGLTTEVTFVVEDRNGNHGSVIQSKVVLVSENQEDFLRFITGKIR